MSARAHPAIGIDLGTTFSAIAHLDDLGRPQTLVNAEGDKITPSTVFFQGADVVVGKEAVKAMWTEAAGVADCAKREMGQRVYHKVLDGRRYPPEAIQACVLNKLRQDARRQIGDFSRVVITVPAYFDEVRRKATQDAGYIAGLEVLDILNEPTAAALAFGFRQGLLEKDRTGERMRILVYDLGGGTFDVTVMEIGDRDFRALATDGDVRLGGRDWDQRLMDYVAEQFQRQHGLDPRADMNAAGKLWRECEDVKRALSARVRTAVAFEYQGRPLRIEITRELFQELTRDLLDRTTFTTRQTLQAAGLRWEDLDRILLVGGSSRMPAVRDMLKELSGKEPDGSISPDEAVAQGAAMHAGALLDKHAGRPRQFHIRNVNSHSLGVVATDVDTGRSRNAVVIPRNTPLPVTAQRVFKLQKHKQRSILVQVIEGESAAPDHCSHIGRCTVRDLPSDLPAQTPIEVLFHYRENGRLVVTVRVGGTRTRLQHEFVRQNSMTQQQLDSWRDYIHGLPMSAG